MATAKRKASRRAAATEKRPTRLASIPGVQSAGSDDSEEPSATDDALAEFLAAPPATADTLHVVAASPSGDAIVAIRQRAEVLREPDAHANRISDACERWSQSERRLVRFRASWHRGEKVVATHAFEHGTANSDGPMLDGTVQSFLIQQQHAQLANHKLHLEGFEMVQESWKSLLAIANRRNDALEKENQELRDRLRRLDDVGNEIALESARAELEARGRTADLIEKRLLPIAQAVVAQKLQESSAALAGSADHKHVQEQHEQPAAES